MKDTTKIVFDSEYPFFGVFLMIIMPLCSAILLVALFDHIKDHPILSSVFALFLSAIILGVNVEKIIVETDRFTIITRRLIPAFTTGKVFLYSTIASIKASLPLTELGDVHDSSKNFLRPPQFERPTKNNSLIVRYKDGVEVELSPAIYQGAFHMALDHIKKLSDISIVASDK